MKKTRSRKFQRNVNRNLKDFHLNSRNQDVSKSVPISLDQGKSPPHSSTLEVDILAESFSSLEIDCESINSITSTEEDREDFVIHIGAEIKDWSIRHNITNSATSDLLKILRSHNCFSELPADSRSLLSTPRETSTITVAPGKYVAFEWVRYVKDIVSRNVTKFPSKVVNLQINIDGIPLTKSSSQQFWPILGGILDDVFIIGIYFGEGKPSSVNEYLNEFLKTFKLCADGVLINDQLFTVRISALVCDAPARAYVLGTKCHNGYKSCGKCTINGLYFKNRVTFPYEECARRTDETFRSALDPAHHNECTIIRDFNFDLIDGVPCEYMHLVCLGVVRKLLHLLIRGKKCPGRLRPHEIDNISLKLVGLVRNIPSEFARKPRRLKELDNWKATEFRQFVLYTGPVVLKNNIPNDQYEHFLCLHVAISILADKNLHKTCNDYANDLLHYFVQHFGRLYGKENLSFNIHGLLHLARDCLIHGALDDFSGFRFENQLQIIKKLIRGPSNQLSQAHRRLIERESQISATRGEKLGATFLHTFQFDDYFNILPHPVQYFSKYLHPKFSFRVGVANSVCELVGGDIVVVKTFATHQGEKVLLGRKFKEVVDYYKKPCSSSLVNVKLVSSLDLLCKYKVEDIQKKLVLLPCEEKYLAIPLLHTSK